MILTGYSSYKVILKLYFKSQTELEIEKFYSAFSYFMEVLSLRFSGGARTVWIRDRKAEKFTNAAFVCQIPSESKVDLESLDTAGQLLTRVCCFCAFCAVKYAESIYVNNGTFTPCGRSTSEEIRGCS